MTVACNLVEVDRETWDACWKQVCRSPLLQSWEYGEAKRRSQRFRPERFAIRREDGTPVGLMQALVYSLPLVGGVARINRGPVFLTGADDPVESPQDLEAIFNGIKATARQRRWRLTRIAPELPAGDEAAARLCRLGFKSRPGAIVTASAVIDIGREPDEIRAGFHGKWRNLLKKSEKMALELETPSSGDALAFLIDTYESMQRDKGFKGVPTSLLRQMVAQEGPTWTCRILFARHEKERCGMVMIVGHGDTCTYVIGWTSKQGRALQANYFLLWQSMLLFRDLGYRFFDVGGLGANTTAGVHLFKRRLNGQEYSLVGEYSYSTLPLLR